MSINEQIQNSVVNLVETFEKLRNQLEEKHFGKVLEEESDQENITEEQATNFENEFLESMHDVFEDIGYETVEKLYLTSINIVEACDIIYPFDDENEDEIEGEIEARSEDALQALNGDSSD
jgi:hypothetical protein